MTTATMPTPTTSTPAAGPMAVQAYLSFEGRCEEALAYYRDVLGAEVTAMMRFGDMPAGEAGEGCAGMTMPPADKIMHSTFRVGATELMATDGMCQAPATFSGISLTLPMPSASDVQRVFAALANGGAVQMPLGRTFFSPMFGVVADKFGVTWMVLVPAAE